MEKAKKLVEESGTKGMKITIVPEDKTVVKSIGIYLQSVMNELGYDASVKPISPNIQFTYIQNTNNKVQMSVTQWYQDYPAASDFANILFGCSGFTPGSDSSINTSGFCDKDIDAKMQAALSVGVTDQPAADQMWTEIDKAITDKAPMAALVFFLLILVSCLSAPIYAKWAGVNPFTSTLDATIILNGTQTNVMEQSTEGLGLGYNPIGPTWQIGNYFLGADSQGRDVMARLLYGGLTSIIIAGGATILTLLFATVLGLSAGFFGGVTDMILSRILDILWAFPVYLLAISLSIVMIAHGIEIGPFTIESGSLWLPIFIIGIIYIPYVARPVRGQVLSLRESEFVLAAISLGVPSYRILFRDILPNVTTTLIVFVPLMMALNMLTESALSFLSIGVQPPDASWGTINQDGQGLLYSRPWVALAPGIAIVITVLTLNVLGDGLRDALDPRSKIKLGRG